MCGRTACTLSKDQLRRRCAAVQSGGRGAAGRQPPDWRDLPGSPPYRPGYNLPPGTFLPVLYSDPAGGGVCLISTMKWGLVPSWVGKDTSGFSLHMSNARVETLMEKASFRNLVAKRRRCALLCEGFYEWRRPKAGPKQAYFFLPSDWRPAGKSEAAEEPVDAADGSGLMLMAALFDVHKELPGQPDLHSFTVVTVPASAAVSQVHDRMPAILQTADQISAWLQSDDPKQALACLQSVTSGLCFYPVSPRVNSTQHNDSLCLQPVKLEPAGAAPTLDKWLPHLTGVKHAETPPKPSPAAKKPPPPPDTGLTRWLRFESKKATAAALPAERIGDERPKEEPEEAKKPRLG